MKYCKIDIGINRTELIIDMVTWLKRCKHHLVSQYDSLGLTFLCLGLIQINILVYNFTSWNESENREKSRILISLMLLQN